MLIMSRRRAESIEIRPGKDIDSSMTLADLFDHGPIEITIVAASENRVKIGLQAPEQLVFWRKEPKTA